MINKNKKRCAVIERETSETKVKVGLNLDGTGNAAIKTGIPFLDHMLHLFAVHGKLDLEVEAGGDLAVDGHHTVEDVGICLGLAVKEALGSKKGIERYGYCLLPMDEAMVAVALDFSGRGYLVCQLELPSSRVGDFDTELVEEFLRAFAVNGALTLHVRKMSGSNTHHIIEAAFKGFGRALGSAARIINPDGDIPSSKGIL